MSTIALRSTLNRGPILETVRDIIEAYWVPGPPIGNAIWGISNGHVTNDVIIHDPERCREQYGRLS